MKCEQALALCSVGVLLVPFVFDLCFMPCKIFVSLHRCNNSWSPHIT